jgi:NIMA (never in mitosis gene a)-related kinase
MTRGLQALHEKSILHRDLKSANVFMELDGVIKLGDLNVSKIVQKDGLLFT